MLVRFETVRFESLKKLAADHFGELSFAEEEVRRISSASEDGDDETQDRNEIRAPFLRWLATDKDAAPYVDPLGLRACNNIITSSLDLRSCKVPFPLSFDYCTFQEPLFFGDAELAALYFFECKIDREVIADGLNTTGPLLLRNLEFNEEISLIGCEIGVIWTAAGQP